MDSDYLSPGLSAAAGVAIGHAPPHRYVQDVFGGEPVPPASASASSMSSTTPSTASASAVDDSWRLQYIDPSDASASTALSVATSASASASSAKNSGGGGGAWEFKAVEVGSESGRSVVEYALKVLIREHKPNAGISEANSEAWLTLEPAASSASASSAAAPSASANSGAGPAGGSNKRGMNMYMFVHLLCVCVRGDVCQLPRSMR